MRHIVGIRADRDVVPRVGVRTVEGQSEVQPARLHPVIDELGDSGVGAAGHAAFFRRGIDRAVLVVRIVLAPFRGEQTGVCRIAAQLVRGVHRVGIAQDVVQHLAGHGNDLIRGVRFIQQDIGVVVALLVPLVAGFRHPVIIPVPVEGIALPEIKRRIGAGGLAQRELNAA